MGWFQRQGQATLVGVTPFFLAAIVADVEVMKFLVAAGADPVKSPTPDRTDAAFQNQGKTSLSTFDFTTAGTRPYLASWSKA